MPKQAFQNAKKSGKSLYFLIFLRFDTILGLRTIPPQILCFAFSQSLPSAKSAPEILPDPRKGSRPLFISRITRLCRAGEGLCAAPERSISAVKKARPLRPPTREGRDFRKRYLGAFPITSRSQTVSSAGSSVRMSRTEISAPRESSSPMAEI